MNFSKKMVISIYSFIAAFSTATYIANVLGKQIQEALIVGVCGAVGLESLITGYMKIQERKAEQKARREEREAEQNKNAGESGRKVD